MLATATGAIVGADASGVGAEAIAAGFGAGASVARAASHDAVTEGDGEPTAAPGACAVAPSATSTTNHAPVRRSGETPNATLPVIAVEPLPPRGPARPNRGGGASMRRAEPASGSARRTTNASGYGPMVSGGDGGLKRIGDRRHAAGDRGHLDGWTATGRALRGSLTRGGAAAGARLLPDPAANAVTFLNCGEVRQAPILSGLIMPWSLSPYLAAAFIAAATELARLTCDLGYEGLINIDGIVTADGRVVINEFNGRIGGCSHIHHILRVIAGAGYGDRLVVASHSRDAGADFDRVTELLAACGLGFNDKTGRGIILTGEDCAASGYLEYLSVAPTRTEVMRLEAAFETLLDGLGQAEGAAQQSGIEHLARILAHLPPVPPEAGRENERDAGPLQGAAGTP